ncbi:MAG: polysaccharide deacetylase family protein [Bacteroidetes bacterium]|nr:polysaccharide deacetylase family protein [Bacteroidota bacterium]
MLLIYTYKITNRVKYIMGLFFRDILQVEYDLISDLQEFESYDGPKMSYGKNPVDNEFFLAAEHLLFERKINHIDLNFIEYLGIAAFFPVYNKLSALPFDPFAAGFYMVSRYEEYLPYKKDEYGRFSAKESIAFQKNFLHKPVVNIWAREIMRLLKERYPTLAFDPPKYRFIPTIDIDAAWAYRQKGLFRTTGGYLNALYHLDFREMMERTRVLAGIQTDPFDTYDFQLKIHRKYKLNPVYFILFAEYGLNDKNIPFRNRKFQTLIKSLADHARIGIHPSFNSNNDFKRLKMEVERLSRVLNREITKSRQHFLVIQLPTTYRNLINLDITDDYSMGFAAQPGFRAGICTTYRFYDLDLDTETKLRIHPFTYMEGTLKDYLHLSADEARKVIKPLIREVKDVNGTFISIWHNESLSDTRRWQGWQQVYEDMIQEALP